MFSKRVTAMFIALFMLGNVSSWTAADLEEGVKDLAGKITKSMIEKGTRKIAIVDFSDLNGSVTALGQFMAEALTTQLFMLAPGKFEIVERRQLLKLEEELILEVVKSLVEITAWLLVVPVRPPPARAVWRPVLRQWSG
ncbi:hypothetical protein [Nitrospira sp. Kam-Ns4a]